MKKENKLKEKSFKFRESFGAAVKTMDDKTAGKFVKSICEYVFEGKAPTNNDSTLKSSFTLVKAALDAEARDKAYGKLGGLKSAAMRKNPDTVIDIRVGQASTECPSGEELLKASTDMLKKVLSANE